MDCQTCEDLMMDLLYEELDEVRSAAARKHLEGCASCKASWARVSGGRSLAASLTPPEAPPVNDALRAAIHAAAERYSAPPVSVPVAANDRGVAPVIPIESAPKRVPSWLRRVGEVAMRRQVAMVAISLLTVGVGLRMLPFQSPTRAPGGEVTTAPEVVPATELPPAEVAHPSAEPGHGEALLRHVARPPAERRAPVTQPALAQQQQAPTQAVAHSAAPPTANNVWVAPATHGATSGSDDTGRANLDGRAGAAYRVVSPSRGVLGAGSLNVPSSVRTQSNGVSELEGALPPSPVNAESQQGLAAQGSADPAWRATYRTAEDQRLHGDTQNAIVSYRQALAQNPPANERRQMQQALYAILVRAGGHEREAAELRASMSGVPQAGSLGDEVLPPTSTSTPSTTRPVQSSRPMPITTHPARRSSNAAQDSYQNSLGF